MIIKKNFDAFKNIIKDKEKSKILFKPNNYFYKLIFIKNPKKEIIVENEKIIISIKSGDYVYNVKFIRERTNNHIEIVNSILGRVFWYFLNLSISRRIENNWENACKQDKAPNVEDHENEENNLSEQQQNNVDKGLFKAMKMSFGFLLAIFSLTNFLIYFIFLKNEITLNNGLVTLLISLAMSVIGALIISLIGNLISLFHKKWTVYGITYSFTTVFISLYCVVFVGIGQVVMKGNLDKRLDIRGLIKNPEKNSSSISNFKFTTKDFYIDKFGKTPDYGNYIDVSSAYFTPNILYSRTTEVLNKVDHKRYGKLYEGISYVNRRIELNSDDNYTEFSHRAELNFYLGNHKDALLDINKSISLLDKNDYSDYGDLWAIKNMLKLRSQIKYMLGDYNGAIKDLKERYNFSIKRDINCKIEYYYWFMAYYLAMDDYSNASLYFEKINSYQNYGKECGTKGIRNIKSKANKLNSYMK